MRARSLIFLLPLALASHAFAQDNAEEKKGDPTLKKAGEIASQPARDVGIAKTKVPDVLARAVAQPYARPTPRTCAGINASISELSAVLGPDFTGDSKANEDKLGKLAVAGGEAIVNTLIPFRGLVREVSGAAPAERRLQTAVNAGLARRGYLRGLAESKGCKASVGVTAPAKK